MTKITEAIKGFVNKHFTQEVTCSHCGKKGKILFFSTLKDGNNLCASCKHQIPEQFKFEAKESTLEKFKELYDYVQNSKNNLEPIFQPTESYSYGTFEVDATHNLCRIDRSFVFEINHISTYIFDFKPEEFKEGIFSSKVKGDVYLVSLTLEKPFAAFGKTIIKSNAKGKAENPVFSSAVIYHNPTEMDFFLLNFNALVKRVQEGNDSAV